MQGRLEERQLLDSFVERVRGGSSATLVLVGEAGIGKTRLLDGVAGAADGVRCARTGGAEAETHLGYAGLHRLLRPFLDRSDHLPDPQRTALATVFGRVGGPAPDLFLVGLATLTLLADVAADAPVVCLVDDAQWLDPESLAVLAFVGRRLDADGIGLLIGVRDDPAALAVLRGLPSHPVAGLTADDARRLVADTAPSRLDPHVADRIVAETGGNPLALLEVTGALTTEQLAGASVLPEHLPIGERLEAHFVRRVRVLPPDTRRLVLLLAAAPGDDEALLWRAAARLGVEPAALDPAISAGVVRGHTIRHPLIRSAVYADASPADRRAVHAALGHVTVRADRRAWHRAESVAGLDDTVADELENAASGARGGAARAAFWSRAAELTSDAPRRAERFLAAARTFVVIGDTAAAASRLDRATPWLTRPAARAAAQRVRASVEWYGSGVAARAPAILLDALSTFGPLDGPTARAMLWEAMTAGLLAGRYTEGVTLLDVARAAARLPPSDRPTVADRALDAFAARIAGDYARAAPLLRTAVATMRTEDFADGAGAEASVGSWAAIDLWDDDGLGAVLTRMEEFQRAQGALQGLNSTLSTVALWKVAIGRFAEAEAHHDEATELCAAMGLPPRGDAHRVELFAWQGREDQTRAAADLALRVWGAQLRYGVLEAHARYALVVLELGLGRYREALDAAERLLADDPPGEGNRVLADAVEAAVRAGDRAAARFAFDRLASRAPVSGTPWALGLLARCRALLADPGDAEALYKESIEQLDRTSVRTDLARTHLLYGEWLRRQGRRADARDQLRVAHERFTAMGAAAFATRAEHELRATGASVRKRTPAADVSLTAQELQVARLASRGATNAEIATRLFVTASTVEYHLNKTFRKLNITSRRQLAGVLDP
ncbi:helix-turn-helix transcriptional regulator [Cryptosporangium arvum]|uniref:helix-turn-helix transcriptional regulator n=1 Tax=Cryptosporangium arvum TaxID=80871 RepID=UPI0004B6EE80|nr:LuxR family transcriptional regulator [Cryptosporangium arvum]